MSSEATEHLMAQLAGKPCPNCYPPIDPTWQCATCDARHYTGSPDDGCDICGETFEVVA